jgi:hypothetical protein
MHAAQRKEVWSHPVALPRDVGRRAGAFDIFSEYLPLLSSSWSLTIRVNFAGALSKLPFARILHLSNVAEIIES